jgi:hypothetical protein
MGLGNLTDRSTGQTITQEFFNDIHSVLNGSFVGRNSSGAATSGQDLGTAALPWGTIRSNALVINGQSVDVSQISRTTNQVLSGKTRSSSNQPQFISPSASLAFTVLGSATNLVVDISGSTVTVTTDIVKTGITAAPSSTNTALINDADAADQEDTRQWGAEYHTKKITVDTMGANFGNFVGKWIAFSINDGSNTEYAMGYLESSTSISRVKRGYFFDSSGSPVKPVKFANNDTVTVLQLGFVFIDDDTTTVDVTYNNPTWAYSSPAAPVTGDYWYDLDNDLWKRYDGASFQIIGRTLIGVVCSNTTAVVGARARELYNAFDDYGGVEVEIKSTEIAWANMAEARIKVNGKVLEFGLATNMSWNITTDLAATADMHNATEQASTYYYLYITDEGDCLISDIAPYLVNIKNNTWYHPYNPWRCVGDVYNDGSSNITKIGSWYNDEARLKVDAGNGQGSGGTKIRRFTNTIQNTGTAFDYLDDATNGASITIRRSGYYSIYFQDVSSGGVGLSGISKNASSLTVSISSLSSDQQIGYGTEASEYAQFSVTTLLKQGDIIRPHGNGSEDDTGTSVMLIVDYVGSKRRG